MVTLASVAVTNQLLVVVVVVLIGAATFVEAGLSSPLSVISRIATTAITPTHTVLEAEELAFTIEKEAQFLQQVYRNVG